MKRPGGMSPSSGCCHRFHPHDPFAIERNLRLEEHDILVAFECVTDRALELKALENAGSGFSILGAIELIAVAAILFRPIHGAVSMLHELTAGLTVIGIDSDPDTSGASNFVPLKARGRGEGLEKTLRCRNRLLFVAKALEHDRELVATETSGYVDVAEILQQSVRDDLEQTVAQVVS
jgi:hypothetical protein